LIAYAAMINDKKELLRYTELVECYQADMFRIARSVLYDHQLAEDAVQNALYGVAVSFNKVPTEEDAARAYLLNCAKYAALRIKKSEQRIETTELTEVIEVSPSPDPTFEAIQNSNDYERLLNAIRQLSEDYQDVLLHYYVFEQSVKEIAKLFGERSATIRQRLSRGRKLLAELCRKEGIGNG
jgi:RNA polymerase sigma factor, sigma-70 family